MFAQLAPSTRERQPLWPRPRRAKRDYPRATAGDLEQTVPRRRACRRGAAPRGAAPAGGAA
eukprot:8241102-Pyramimonas_sp.AAC.1